MISPVLDCSVAMSFLFEDEANENNDRLIDYLIDNGVWVPSLWHLEVANVLLQAAKHGCIEFASVPKRQNLLTKLPIKTDHDTIINDVLNIAEETGFTAYDAAYLELALRRNLHLITNDKALKKAAQVFQVPIVE